MIRTLLHWIRWIIYGIAGVAGIVILLVTWLTIPTWTLQLTQLSEWFGFTAIIFLYLTLLISPLYEVFPHIPGKPVAVKGRQALGISTFMYGLIHACFSFWGLLGGFAGLAFLNSSYLIAISLSFTALVILGVQAASDWPPIHLRLGRWWKRLHRFVYIASLLIVVHLLILGSHFSSLSRLVPQLFFALLFFIIFLDLIRLDRYLSKRFLWLPQTGVAFTAGCIVLGVAAYLLYSPVGSVPSINIHAAHIQLAQQAQQTTSPFSGTQFAGIPGLTGDRTRRYSVSFSHDPVVQANSPTILRFTVNDASSGNPVQIFETIYTKTSHLIVVDSQLTYFTHIHPDLSGPTFTMKTSFPHEGIYHLYLDFDPFGAIEQQFAFTLQVGNPSGDEAAHYSPDKQLTKTFGDYVTTINTHGVLHAKDLSIGRQLISFALRDAKSKQPLTNLQPYLGAFGHLVMINEATYDYLHVHPYALANAMTGGPTVDFMPLGIYGPIKPGTYRLFAQFNPNGHLFIADYTVNIEP